MPADDIPLGIVADDREGEAFNQGLQLVIGPPELLLALRELIVLVSKLLLRELELFYGVLCFSLALASSVVRSATRSSNSSCAWRSALLGSGLAPFRPVPPRSMWSR